MNYSVSKVKNYLGMFTLTILKYAYHSKPSSVALASGVDNLINQLNSKKIQNNIYTFGSELDTNWSSGRKNSPRVLQILASFNSKSNKNENSAGSVIITDGQANLGKELEKNLIL